MNNKGWLVVLLSIAFLYSSEEAIERKKAPYYSPGKYEGLVDNVIDKYMALCLELEQRHACRPDFTCVRLLVFTHPCVIRCYTEMVQKKSLRPLVFLWEAYKSDTIECQKKKFIYELCHLIFLVFEQMIMQLVSEATGESPESLRPVFEKIDAMIPFDELIEVLEQCYAKLNTILLTLETPQESKITFKKRWAVVAIATLVLVKKMYDYFYPKP